MVKNTINQYIILSGCITMLSLGFDLLVTPIYELFPLGQELSWLAW